MATLSDIYSGKDYQDDDFRDKAFSGEISEEKEWRLFFRQSQKVLGLFLMFTFITGGLVLLILSFNKKSSSDIDKTNILGAEQPASSSALPAQAGLPAVLLVDLAGAVNQPGVFKLTEGSRLEDLLTAAGGLSAAADQDWALKNLNLAEKLFDGEKIYIPSRHEVAAGSSWEGRLPPAAPPGGAKLNINTAAAAHLDTLPGLSPADAQSIVEYRQKNGPFKNISEIQRVSGIKAGKFAKIKDLITVN